MARLKHLLVAILTAAGGAYYLHERAETESAQIRVAADDRLKGGATALASALAANTQALTAQVRGLQFAAIAEAMDDEGKPTAEALEATRTAIEKSSPADAERPVVVVVAAQGVGGRYHLGQSNRFDRDLSAFPVLTEGPNSAPRTGVGMLDGELRRYAVIQFDDTKAAGAKGLIALGYPLDDTFARKIAGSLPGVDVLLLQKDKVIGSTLAPADRQLLQSPASTGKGSFDVGGASGESFALAGIPLPVFVKPARYRAEVLGGAPGLPADVKVVLATRTLDHYGTIAEDQKSILELLGALVALSLLMMILSTNPSKGLSRVVTAAERLAQGDHGARAPTDHMTALVRRAAVAINSLAGQIGAGGPVPAGPSFAEQLGLRPPASRAGGAVKTEAIEEPSAEPQSTLPTIPPTAAPEGNADVEKFLGVDTAAEPTTVMPALAVPPAPRPTAPASPATSGSGSQAAFMTPKVPASSPAAPAAPAAAPAPVPAYQAPLPEEDFGQDQTVVAQTPEALLRATQRSTSLPSPSSTPPASSGAVPLPPPTAANSEEAHFQQVFKEFVATREKCNEPPDGLTYDKFVTKLRKNQEQLVQKYQCRTVRFQVYVKDGKAALKATPVR